MAIKVADGVARKIAPIFIGLSFIGWTLFVAGFGLQNKKLTDNPYYDYKIGDSTLYAYWAGSVIGPFVCILAVAHALLWGFPSAIVGSVTSVLLIMYISAVGYVLVGSGIAIKKDNDGDIDYGDLRTALNLQFSGGLITTFFWVFVLALWPWYKNDTEGQYHGV